MSKGRSYNEDPTLSSAMLNLISQGPVAGPLCCNGNRPPSVPAASNIYPFQLMCNSFTSRKMEGSPSIGRSGTFLSCKRYNIKGNLGPTFSICASYFILHGSHLSSGYSLDHLTADLSRIESVLKIDRKLSQQVLWKKDFFELFLYF